ncbi:MAG TPA: Uma2 family endonuclease [Gemmataceae bacterium]|jgi:Uma2 family endonuclease|nr:Uma2 family endonuclease [Gemmataceae bacterium]
MTMLLLTDESIQIPDGINDLAAFRRWFQSDSFPEEGRLCFLDGAIWVDTGMEQLFTHNQLKNEIAFVLTGLAKKSRLGRFFADGIQIVNLAAELSSQPDGTFVSHASLRDNRVKLVPGRAGGYAELEGVPDMVLEVVSRSSIYKDTERLIDLYWRAGVPEYWLADARTDTLRFDIFRHGSKGYKLVRKVAGYTKSRVFGKAFQFTRQLDESGNPEFSLAVR